MPRLAVDAESSCGLHPGSGPCRICDVIKRRIADDLARTEPYYVALARMHAEETEEEAECS